MRGVITNITVRAPQLMPAPRDPASPPPKRAPLPPPPYEPTVAELASNFAGAMGRVIIAGIAGRRIKTTFAEYVVRSAVCASCEYWRPEDYGGVGRCAAPGCGCTKLKRWLVTEQCKHPKGSRWAPLDASASP